MNYLIAFLGNPGTQYKNTRHNAGVRCIEHLSFYHELSWQEKFKGRFARHVLAGADGGARLSPSPGSVGSITVGLLIPQTFMNRSGESVSTAASFYKLKSSSVIIVHDDLETEFGKYDIKKGGGLGGHNGLRSIAGLLASKDFIRLRIGISRPKRGSVSSYVLGKFTPEEAAELPGVLEEAARLLEEYVKGNGPAGAGTL